MERQRLTDPDGDTTLLRIRVDQLAPDDPQLPELQRQLAERVRARQALERAAAELTGGPRPAPAPRQDGRWVILGALALLLLVGGLSLRPAPRTERETPRSLPAGQAADARALLARARPELGLEARLRLCDEALRLSPGLVEGWIERGRLRWALERARGTRSPQALTAGALEDAARALLAAPSSAAAHLLQAELRLARGERAAAEAALERAAGSASQGSAAGETAAGILEALRGRRAAAEARFSRALARDADWLPAWRWRARVQLELGQAERALADAGEARRRDPGCAEALACEAEATWLTTGESDPAGARASLERALRLEPAQPRALALQAWLALAPDAWGRAGRAAPAARDDAALALALEPGSLLAGLALAAQDAAEGDTTRALTALAALPHPRACLLTARLRWERAVAATDQTAAQADFAAARDALDLALAPGAEALLTASSRAHALSLQARLLIRSGRPRLGVARAEDALRLAPGLAYARAARGLGQLARHLGGDRRPATPGLLEQALSDLGAALTPDAAGGAVLVWRAEALLVAGQPEEALRHLEQARPLLREPGAEVSLRALERLYERALLAAHAQQEVSGAEQPGAPDPATAASEAERAAEEQEQEELLRLLLLSAAAEEEPEDLEEALESGAEAPAPR